jgi:hypothetical protein
MKDKKVLEMEIRSYISDNLIFGKEKAWCCKWDLILKTRTLKHVLFCHFLQCNSKPNSIILRVGCLTSSNNASILIHFHSSTSSRLIVGS